MNPSPPAHGRDLISLTVNLFTSVRLTVVLIAALALLSFCGTTGREFELNLPGPGALYLNFTEVYHSPSYRLLLGLLFTNLLICSLNLLPGAWRRFRQDAGPTPPPFPRQPDYVFTIAAANEERVLQQAESILFGHRKGIVRHERRLETNAGADELEGRGAGENRALVSFVAEGRLSLLGPHLTHLALLLILAGGIAGSLLEFEASVYLHPGEETNVVYRQIRLPRPGARTALIYWDPEGGGDERGRRDKYIYQTREEHLDFTLRCHDFTILFYPGTEQPRDYIADLAVVENGVEVRRQKVEVNRPLHYRGYGIYQSSYEPDVKFRLTAVPRSPADTAPEDNPDDTSGPNSSAPLDGESVSGVVNLREPWTVPGDTAVYVVYDYQPAMIGMEGRDMGPTIMVGRLAGSTVESFRLFERFPAFDQKHNQRADRYWLCFTAEKKGWRTGLQIIRDPALPLTYAGFALLIAGVTLSLSLPHRRFWLVVAARGPANIELSLIGRSRRARLLLARRLKNMADALSRELGVEIHRLE